MKYGKVSEGGTYMEAKPGRQKSKLRFSLEKVNQTSDFDKRFDKLWERGKNLYPFAIRRNSEFLNWRFTKHPKNSYKIFKVSDYGKNLKAYVVILKEKNLAKIIDVFSDGNKKSLQRLMQYILNDMYDDETQKIVVWLPKEHFITQTFADSGFCFQKEPLGIVPTGRSFDENLSFDFTAKNIFYTMADGDLF